MNWPIGPVNSLKWCCSDDDAGVPSERLTSCRPPRPGPPHTDQAEHHAAEAGSEVWGSSSLWAGRLAQHRQDSHAHAAGRLPAACQRTHARRPAALCSELSTCWRSSPATQPPQKTIDPQPGAGRNPAPASTPAYLSLVTSFCFRTHLWGFLSERVCFTPTKNRSFRCILGKNQPSVCLNTFLSSHDGVKWNFYFRFCFQ